MGEKYKAYEIASSKQMPNEKLLLLLLGEPHSLCLSFFFLFLENNVELVNLSGVMLMIIGLFDMEVIVKQQS